jgi:hypothetical protein
MNKAAGEVQGEKELIGNLDAFGGFAAKSI